MRSLHSFHLVIRLERYDLAGNLYSQSNLSGRIADGTKIGQHTYMESRSHASSLPEVHLTSPPYRQLHFVTIPVNRTCPSVR